MHSGLIPNAKWGQVDSVSWYSIRHFLSLSQNDKRKFVPEGQRDSTMVMNVMYFTFEKSSIIL